MTHQTLNSPLSEVSPTSLDELFSKDPVTLTDSEVDAIVDYYRKSRHLFAQKEAEDKAQGKKSSAKKAPKASVGSLDELGDLLS